MSDVLSHFLIPDFPAMSVHFRAKAILSFSFLSNPDGNVKSAFRILLLSFRRMSNLVDVREIMAVAFCPVT